MNIPVIYADDYLMVVNKPAGLVVESALSVREKTLTDYLQKDFGITLLRGGLVHRLDKDTSGIIIVAKTEKALEYLQAQFKNREVKKEYLALVHGYIKETGRVEGDIGRNPGNREKFTVLEDAKEAVTEYEPLENLQFTAGPQGGRLQETFSGFNKIQMRKLSTAHYNLFTLLKCFPKTGRTHQIRVHLKHINFPIVSDEKYVGRKMFRLDKRWCDRMFLHAKSLGFYHPVSGEWTEFKSELPEDLKQALEKLN